MSLLDQDTINEVSEDHRLLLVEQVRKWGDLNTNAVLDNKCRLFTVPYIDGLIAYRVESKCAVVFGDPLCALKDQVALADAFKAFCQEHKLGIVYTLISQQFADVALNRYGNVLIQFGHKLVLNPQEDQFEKKGSNACLVRKKVRKAINEGVSIVEYDGKDPVREQTMQSIGEEWLSKRSGPQIHIASLNVFNDRQGKRWFYATKDNRIIGFLVLHRLETSSGWLLNNLITTNDAPPGVSELLIINVLDRLRQEGCERIVIGPVTAESIDNIVGLNKLGALFVHAVFKTSKVFFRLDKQGIFWEKFQPETEPCYLMFDKVNFRTIKALMRAMNARV